MNMLHVEPLTLCSIVHLLTCILLTWVILWPCQRLCEFSSRLSLRLFFLLLLSRIGSGIGLVVCRGVVAEWRVVGGHGDRSWSSFCSKMFWLLESNCLNFFVLRFRGLVWCLIGTFWFLFFYRFQTNPILPVHIHYLVVAKCWMITSGVIWGLITVLALFERCNFVHQLLVWLLFVVLDLMYNIVLAFNLSLGGQAFARSSMLVAASPVNICLLKSTPSS